MLRLYLDVNQGAGVIPCPDCGRPLLLGVERMGRTLVGYQGGFCIRPGRQALLVCPGYDCKHKETAIIAHTANDAVVYDPARAADWYQTEEHVYDCTISEMDAEICRLQTIHQRTGNPKLPSAIRFWRDRYEFRAWLIKHNLERSYREGTEVVCEGNGLEERGRVVAVLQDRVSLERTATGERLFLKAGDLKLVTPFLEEKRPARFDFGDWGITSPGNHPVDTPTRYVTIGPWRLELGGVTRYGLCRVRTDESEAAHALGLWRPSGGTYHGEFPAALVDRAFLVVRHCTVAGYRLPVQSFTRDPEILLLATRSMEAARELKMIQDTLQPLGERRQLRWLRYFRKGEITALAEEEVPIRLPRSGSRGR